jgi:hypothetical protein
MSSRTLIAAAGAAAAGLSLAPAAAQAAPAPENIRIVCAGQLFTAVSPAPHSAAALFNGSTRVGVLMGLNGVMFSGVPDSRVTTCDAFINGEFIGVASVLITPQAS